MFLKKDQIQLSNLYHQVQLNEWSKNRIYGSTGTDSLKFLSDEEKEAIKADYDKWKAHYIAYRNIPDYKETRSSEKQEIGANVNAKHWDRIRDQITHLTRYYGIKFNRDTSRGSIDLPSDGSIVYRGHKSLDPFAQGDDAKSVESGKVYFTNNAYYAIGVYSTNYNSGSTQIGQAGGSTLQWASQPEGQSPNSYGKFKYGFFTMARPKDPESIQWYINFGYEDYHALKAKGGEWNDMTAEEKKLKGQYRVQDDQGFWQTVYPPSATAAEKLKGQKDAECVESRDAFKSVKTYLLDHRENVLVPMDRVRSEFPDLYDMIANGRVLRRNDPARVY